MMTLEVIRPGLLTTVQDLGRPGLGSIGVGTSGALDRGSAAEANRLVGNLVTAAVLEVTMGQLTVRARRRVEIAVTGAPAPIMVDGTPNGHRSRIVLRSGQVVSLGVPSDGVRSYLANRGGIDAIPVLGSRSTDTLSGLGPAPLAQGDLLATGEMQADYPPVDFVPHRTDLPTELTLRYALGPRHEWFADDAFRLLAATRWRLGPHSNRIGMRLDGPPLARARSDELPSEGVVLGSIQVPPSGPIIFMNDHPVTGGYPVIGVVARADLDKVAQARPGQVVNLVPGPDVDRGSAGSVST
jgi:biotin-dependent carboxylase-like uncharacterized protein